MAAVGDHLHARVFEQGRGALCGRQGHRVGLTVDEARGEREPGKPEHERFRVVVRGDGAVGLDRGPDPDVLGRRARALTLHEVVGPDEPEALEQIFLRSLPTAAAFLDLVDATSFLVRHAST